MLFYVLHHPMGECRDLGHAISHTWRVKIREVVVGQFLRLWFFKEGFSVQAGVFLFPVL
jgi:DNA-binding cell septation regulator SpoVG